MSFIERQLREIPSDILFDPTCRSLERWCLERGFRPMWLDVINERRRRPRRTR